MCICDAAGGCVNPKKKRDCHISLPFDYRPGPLCFTPLRVSKNPVYFCTGVDVFGFLPVCLCQKRLRKVRHCEAGRAGDRGQG